ncbi:O-antigen ligase family protein [Roseospira visakhapatnamensis]|uniref:Capsular biosynthesis protein n=1 Tax=Roseospira visakhapatnamensis TaxID=390880 RepID=A0A7W6W8R4_9PROT|nr:O-antigen ligase domain-containing protein [Roseospira visakhapatnamensis]MBB4265295.1 hypothetical protein [Roseospira visakhapatnamensis]
MTADPAPVPSSQGLEDRIVQRTIVWTYGFYAFGALYVVGPVLGWLLFGLFLARLYLTHDPVPKARMAALPIAVWLWVIGMITMEVALIGGHLSFDLGMGKLIKSSIGWAKGWALIAIFILVGVVSDIRPSTIHRAMCVVGLHTLLLTPVLVAAWVVRLPEVLYVSPLKAVGGPGPEFFAVQLYLIDPSNGSPRWQFFTPWAPAAGFMSSIMLVCALAEKTPSWKAAGLAGAVIIAVLSKSRMALLALMLIPLATWGLSRLLNPAILALGALASTLGGLIATTLLIIAEDAVNEFRGARADSTRVREALARIAWQRWRSEAPIWGHGVVERGPHLVEYMPIGSHHSWYGLLFVKGIVGFLALLIPLVWTLGHLIVVAQRTPEARPGLSVALMMVFYSFGENLEILAYLIWPGLILVGAGLRPARRWRSARVPGVQAEHA